MKNSENIEKLFKDTFENFEADVNPNVWTTIQSGMNASAGSAASTAVKFAIGKIIAGTAAVAVVAGSVWYFASSNDKTISSSATKNQTEKVSNPSSEEQAIVTENKSSENFYSSNAAKQSGSSGNSSTENNNTNNQSHSQNISDNSGNNTNADADNAGNSGSSSSSPHKYGSASKGDGGMIRGSQYVNTSSSKPDNSSAESQENESAPAANIIASAESGDVPLTITFSNQGTAASLTWDFGDGSASRENSPTHTFEKPGNYIVSLSSKNSAGNASDKITIEVKQISEIVNVPNIFTPNGDGDNDVFFLKIKNIASIGVVIYSRERGSIAQWNSLEGSWDGKLSNGEDAPAGTYYYSIQAIGTDGITFSKNGFVQLKR